MLKLKKKNNDGIENERKAERTILAIRDIYDNKIKNTSACPKVNSSPTMSATMRKRRGLSYPNIPDNAIDFHKLFSGPHGQIEGDCFYRTYASSGNMYVLIFSTDLPVSLK